MSYRTCLTRTPLALALVLVLLAGVDAAALAAVPALDDPLIKTVAPLEAQQGQQVLISGVNFGTAPVVSFDGVPATIVVYRPDDGRIVVVVPGASGPLVVTNTDIAEASNPADFVLLDDPFNPVCTISGSVTDSFSSPLPDTVVVALDPGTGSFAAAALSAAISGSYSIALGATGDYELLFLSPEGTPYYQGAYSAACTGAQDHQFETGLELTGRVVNGSSTPIPNATVFVEGTGTFGADALTEGTGEFTVFVPPDVYDLQIVGPVGGRLIATSIDSVSVGADTDLGDIALETGVILSGHLRYQDDLDSGPLGGAWVAAFDSEGLPAGMTTSIVDGSFHLATPTGLQHVLFIDPNQPAYVPLEVFSVAVSGDEELGETFTVYSSSAQLPAIPTISETGSIAVQEGQRLQFDVAGLRGAAIEIRFSDDLGGWVNGENTFAEQDRGGLVTTVPPLAATGDVVVGVDGVDSPGYPLTVVPGIYDPGPFTTSGSVDDGAGAVENAFVGIFELTCDDEVLVDYDLTDASGAYSVDHGAGDFGLFVLPPASTGLARSLIPLLGLSGGGTQDITLQAGQVVTARCADSGTGTVGSTAPLRDCEAGGESLDVDHDDWVASDDAGGVALNLPAGSYELFLRAPFASRYIDGESSFFLITEDTDLGDATLDSGYFISGSIVDPASKGLAGVEVSAHDSFTGDEVASTRAVGPDGAFRMAVPPGTYDVFSSMPRDEQYWIPLQFLVPVYQDLLLYPPLQAEIAGHLEGRAVDQSVSPLEAIMMLAYHDTRGFVGATDTCPDGSYDLKVPTGDYNIQAAPSWENPCLADEFYDDHYPGCGADLVALVAPATVTGLDFTLEPAGMVSGTVIGEGGPVQGATVCATAGASSPFCHDACTTTGPDGSYLLAGVPVGTDYQVDAVGPGYPWECWDGHAGCADYDPVAVGNCAETSGIQFHASSAPGPVPDGHHVAGTQMTARRGESPGEITIDWQPTCDADDHAIYFGALGGFSSYTHAVCDAGVSGSRTLAPPGGDLFWIVVGQNGALEGSYGVDGDLVERPPDGGIQCGNVQDLSATCLP